MSISIEQVDDLRTVYLHAFDAFATNPSEVASLKKTWNVRYARELLGALQHGQLLVLTEDGEGSEAWQADPTSDTMSREEAEAKFNGWAKVKPAPTATNTRGSRSSSPKAASGEPHECLCGCGEVLTTRSLYRPGHDARHAGQVGREIAATGDLSLLDALGSDLLREKAKRVAGNAKVKAKPEPTRVEGTVTVGKNEFPGYRIGDEVFYFKGEKTLTASARAAKTFQEG